MPLDGLTMKVLTAELHSLLKNGRVMKIYQPQKDTLVFQIRQPGKTELLLISADPVYPRLHILEKQPPNPLKPPAFCMLLRKHLEPSRLISLTQQGWDRVVHLKFEAAAEGGGFTEKTLILELMGRYSNLFLVDREGRILDVLKRYPQKEIMPGGRYLPPDDQGKEEPTALGREEFLEALRLVPPLTPLWKWILRSFQGFSKVGAQEVLNRSGLPPALTRGETRSGDGDLLYSAFRDLLQEIERGGTPSHHLQNGEDFTAYRLSKRPPALVFPNVNTLLAQVLTAKGNQRQLEQTAQRLRQQLKRHLKRVQKKETLHSANLEQAPQAEELRRQGQLLTANFHLLKKGLSFIDLVDYSQPQRPVLRLELHPELAPSANVQKIFQRYHKIKASQKFSRRQLQKAREERIYLEGVLLQIELAEEGAILEEIAEELKSLGYLPRPGKKKPTKTCPPQKPQRYRSSDGLPILVGRNNRQNDRLTFELCQPGHLWLHAQKIPGSHVVVPQEGPLPPATILQAATLAAYFSQGKNSPKVAVDYTLRKHVRKPKGAKPGFVLYDHFKTVVVDPTQGPFPSKEE